MRFSLPVFRRETEAANRSFLFLVGKATADLIEVLLGRAAQGAHPIGGQILEIGALLNAVIRISDLGTVLVTAQLASIYAHSYPSFHMVILHSEGLVSAPLG
jgi:hypothetical protein